MNILNNHKETKMKEVWTEGQNEYNTPGTLFTIWNYSTCDADYQVVLPRTSDVYLLLKTPHECVNRRELVGYGVSLEQAKRGVEEIVERERRGEVAVLQDVINKTVGALNDCVGSFRKITEQITCKNNEIGA